VRALFIAVCVVVCGGCEATDTCDSGPEREECADDEEATYCDDNLLPDGEGCEEILYEGGQSVWCCPLE
jgi:hypothetical protein